MKIAELLESECKSKLSGLLSAVKVALKNGDFKYISTKRMMQIKETENTIEFTIPSLANRSGNPMTEDSNVVEVLKKAVQTAGISIPLFVKIGTYGAPTDQLRGPDQGKIAGPAKLKIIVSTNEIPKKDWIDPEYRPDVHGPGRLFKI